MDLRILARVNRNIGILWFKITALKLVSNAGSDSSCRAELNSTDVCPNGGKVRVFVVPLVICNTDNSALLTLKMNSTFSLKFTVGNVDTPNHLL